MGRIRNTWALMGASWKLLQADREIMVFPFLSGISCLLVLLSFILPFVFTGILENSEKMGSMSYILLFLFYLANYTVITFFNSAVVACVHIRLHGGDPTVKDGFAAALERLPVILGWALVCATVGLVLRMIEDNSKIIGKIVAGILGMAWTLSSFLVVPILV
ncbi:MAG: DUF6159 family protein, partial [Candidatus Sericytochromatia bacterium]